MCFHGIPNLCEKWSPQNKKMFIKNDLHIFVLIYTVYVLNFL